jgi:hypothetical protein
MRADKTQEKFAARFGPAASTTVTTTPQADFSMLDPDRLGSTGWSGRPLGQKGKHSFKTMIATGAIIPRMIKNNFQFVHYE